MNKYAHSDPLLFRLYGCCSEPRRWSEVLDQVCTEIGVASAVLQGLSLDGSRAAPFWLKYNSNNNLDAYRTKISDARNPRLEARRLLNATSAIHTDDELFVSEERPVREWLEGQLLELGLGRFMGGLLQVSSNRYVALALHRRPNERGNFSTRQRDRAAALLPHLAQAMALSQSVELSRSASALLHGHLDRWPGALLVCDELGRVQWLNQKAMHSLQGRSQLQLRDHQLQMVTSSAQQRLIQALRQAHDRQSSVFLTFDGAEGRLQMAAQALETPVDGDGSLLLVSLTGDEPSGHIPVAALKALFDLTEAEARLASALVAGSTVEQYAQQRGVTVGTARYQLNQVLVKTGAHRQADLVRRVLGCAAAHLANR